MLSFTGNNYNMMFDSTETLNAHNRMVHNEARHGAHMVSDDLEIQILLIHIKRTSIL
jgi:hypothetical protein